VSRQQRSCYGQFSPTRPDCRQSCRYRRWCRQASDPPDIAHSDGARIVELAANPDPDTDTHTEAADLLREALVRLVEAAGGNPRRLAVLIARAGGLSYRQIGARWGISKQAVIQHLHVVTAMNPQVAELLRVAPRVQETVSGSITLAERVEEWENVRRKMARYLIPNSSRR